MVMEIWDKPDNLDVIVSCLLFFLLRPLNLSLLHGTLTGWISSLSVKLKQTLRIPEKINDFDDFKSFLVKIQNT